MTSEQKRRLNELKDMEWDGTLDYLNDYSLFVELEQLEFLADEEDEKEVSRQREFYQKNGFRDNCLAP